MLSWATKKTDRGQVGQNSDPRTRRDEGIGEGRPELRSSILACPSRLGRMGSASSSSAKGMEAAAKLQNTKVVVSPGSADESAQMPANRPHAEATTKPTADIGISSPAPPASPMPPRARPKASIPGQKDGAAGTPDATEGQAAEVQAVDKAELARRKKLQEQEDASLAQMSAAQYQAFEKRMEVKKKKMGTSFEADPAKKQHDSPTKTGRSSSAEGPEDTRRKKLQEQEEASIEQQMAQQYRAFEAQQHGGGGAAPGGHAAGPDEEKARRRKLEEQEASIEQQMAQQYRAFEAQQGGGHGKSGGKPTKEEQEELSIDMMNLVKTLGPAPQSPAPQAPSPVGQLPNPCRRIGSSQSLDIRPYLRFAGCHPPPHPPP